MYSSSNIPKLTQENTQYNNTSIMPPEPKHIWQLKCWGDGWQWVGCKGASEGWGNVSLVPLKQRAVEVTWVWPDWVRGDDLLSPKDGLHYQVEYGRKDHPPMLGRVGGSSRGVTLEEGVEPSITYEVKLTADTMDNTSAIFFQIREITDVSPMVRAEEITLVLLVLLLWVVAIILFVHRWGKIRMLEPYQPEYKPLNHSPACPLAPTTPTQSQQRPPNNPRPLLPRKSSSLCFTPSMLRSVHVPPSCRISVPQIDQTPIHRCTRSIHHSSSSPAHAHSSSIHSHHGRQHTRLRLASDSLDHSSSYSKSQQGVLVEASSSRKVRSAENLRNYRLLSTNRSYEEGCTRGGSCHSTDGGGASTSVCHHPLARRRSCQSQSLDLENYRSQTPLLQDVTPRGRSLDSTSVSSLRRSPTAGPSWAGATAGEPGCTTPELRVSPTPPDNPTPAGAAATAVVVQQHHSSHPHGIVLQRQETIDDALLPVPYATLMEEELENEV